MSWSVAKLKEIAAARGENSPRDSQLNRALAAEAQLRRGGEDRRRAREALDDALKGLTDLPEPHKAEYSGITRLRADIKAQEQDREQREAQPIAEKSAEQATAAGVPAAQDGKTGAAAAERLPFELDARDFIQKDEDEQEQETGQSTA